MAREELLDAAANFDDDLMEKILEGEELESAQIYSALRQGTIDLRLFRCSAVPPSRTKGAASSRRGC